MNNTNPTPRRGELIREGMRKKAAGGGLPHCPPLGYCLDYLRHGKDLMPDGRYASLVWEAFFLAATGEQSLREILMAVTREGLVGRSGKPLSLKGLWGMLTNPFYAGLVRYEGRLIQGRHQALVDLRMFERVQENLRRRRRGRVEIPSPEESGNSPH